MGASLVKLEEPDTGAVWNLGDGIVVIGRSRTCDYPIDSTSVSKQHCQVSRINDFYVVHDLNSRNGTSINGKRISEAYLSHGDVLTIGSVKFRFQSDVPPKAAAPGVRAARTDARPPAAPKSSTSRSLDHETLLRALEAVRGITETDHFLNHSILVRDFALALARPLDLSASEVKLLRLAAVLHDIGLAPDTAEIRKAGPLEPDERKEIEAHASRGADLLRKAGLPNAVVAAVRSHHERFDGSGYPEGLRGTHIPRLAQVLGVAEVVVAMSSDRPYRPRRTRAEIEAELRTGAGIRYAQDVAEAALAHLADPVEEPTTFAPG